MRGVQERSRARCGLTIVRSGEEGLPLDGRRVGESRFRRTRGLESIAESMEIPLAAARSSSVAENQAALWALKSPIMTVLWLS